MLAIYALAAGNFAAGMCTLVMAGVLSEIAIGMNITTGQAGQLISIYSLVYAISAPLIAAFTSGFARRTMLAGGMVMILLGNVAATLAPTYSALLTARIVTAFGAATYVPLAAAVAISMAKPEERGRVSAIVFTGFTLATALGLPIGTFIGLTLGWRFSFASVALLAVGSSYFIWTEVSRMVETPTVSLAILGKAFRNSVLIVVLSVTVLQFAGQMALFAFVAPWLRAFTTLGATGISLILLVVGVGGIVGNYVAGLSTDRFGAKQTQLVLLVLLAVAMVLMPVIRTNFALGVVLIFVWGAAGQGFIAPQLVRLVGISQELSSATLSLNSSFINMGLSLGAVAGGLYIDRIGVETLTWVGVGGTVLSLGVFVLSWMMENSRRTASVVELAK